MTFLPIVERELREGARRKSTRRIRLIVAAVALVISLFQLAFIPFFMRGGAASGSAGFSFMTAYAFVLCLLAGVFITADCISEEKRDGTLGLLFLTDLRGYDVVLGKLAAQLVHLGYALLAIIPAAALPVLMGGVTGGELWRISLALGNLLFFSLACGITASVLVQQAGRAMMLTGSLLALLCIVLPSIQGLLELLGAPAAGKWFAWFSPAQAYSLAAAARYASASDAFWISLGTSHLLAWVLIAFASWRVPQSWQDRPVISAKKSIFARLNFGSREAGIRRNRELLNDAPLLWLIGEQRSVRVIAWGIACVWTLLMIGLAAWKSSEGMLIAVMYGRVLLFPIKLLFAAQACRFFAEARRTGAFELLLASPITTRELVAAQWAALRRVFLAPCLFILLATILSAAYLLLFAEGEGVSGRLVGLGFGGIFGGWYLAESVLDLFALGWLGMWLSLTMRKPHLSAGAAILFVLILPSFLCGVGFIVDIVLIAVFTSKLRADFRETMINQPRVEASA